jgi:hypothetical protein
MTALWLVRPWSALALAALGLGLTIFVAVILAGAVPVKRPDAAVAVQAPCGSCAARNQHVTRQTDAKKTGVSP